MSMEENMASDHVTDSRSTLHGCVVVRIDEDGDEVVSSIASEDVLVPDEELDELNELRTYEIARGMPEGVVDLLERINLEEGQR